MTTDHCAGAGCTRMARVKGYCNTHYERLRTGRDINAPLVPRIWNRTTEDKKRRKADNDRRYREHHAEKIRERKKKDYARNPQAASRRQKQWNNTHREQLNAITRDYRAKHPMRRIAWVFGVGADTHYSDQFDKQQGSCSICGQKARLRPDHNHITGQWRGGLCHACNVALGLFKDDPELIRKAIEYLRYWESKAA